MKRRFPSKALLAALLVAGSLSGSAALADEPPARTAPPKPIEVLEKAWPDHPEWVAMLVDILDGSQLGPGDGWFRKAVAQTRFTWDSTRAAHSTRTAMGRSPRSEFGGQRC